MTSYNLTHLKQLEAESIHIIREVAAEFEKPVMLYSIGKDSSVMVRLAEKAFYPGKPPFPLMHVDTTWKFREMIAFREDLIRHKLGWDLIVYINEEGVKQGVGPFTHGSEVHTDIMKTEALKQALNKYKFDAAFGGGPPRRRKVAGQGARLSRFATRITAGTPRTSGPNCGTSTTARSTRARASACFRFPTGPSSTCGSTSTWKRSRSCRCTSRRSGRW